MKIGITGTRSGCTPYQLAQLRDILQFSFDHKNSVAEFHHGDCVGVDVEAAIIAANIGFKTVCHPPINDDLRAWHESDVILEPLSYFARNRNIVDETALLLVVPWQTSPQNSGGTWYTHDYSVKQKKPSRIIYPEPVGLDLF